MTKMTYREAVRSALREALREDPRVFLMGEDVGRYGGAFACQSRPARRVRSRAGSRHAASGITFVGAGIGAALGGLRPIVEVMTVNFSLLALDQIVNNAATLRHMSGDRSAFRWWCAWRRGVAGSSPRSTRIAWRCGTPTSPASRCSRRAPSGCARATPWRRCASPTPSSSSNTRCSIPWRVRSTRRRARARSGAPWCAAPVDDLTLVTYGGSLPKTLEAADELAMTGIEAEVIDLRTLRPLDTATILGSVAKTHRALIVDEGWQTCSFAAEISARIMERGFYDLDAPVRRVCSAEVPLPYARHLEDAALPQAATIAAAARAMVRRDG